MKWFKSFIIVMINVILAGSCNEKVFTADVDCNDCYVEKPSKDDLIIALTINNKYPRVPITVYLGDAEKGQIVISDTADSSPYYVYVPVDKVYSVRAEYKLDNTAEVIYAVDGTNLKALAVSDACDARCYVIANQNLDVRLKKNFP